MKNFLFAAVGFLVLFPAAVFADCTMQTNTAHNNAGFNVGDTTTLWNAVPFTPSCSGTVASTTIAAYTSGTGAVGNFEIWTSSGGVPSARIGTAGPSKTVQTGSCITMLSSTLPSPSVTSGTEYWLVWHTSTGAANNFWCNGGTPTGLYKNADGATDPPASWYGASGAAYAVIDVVAGVTPPDVVDMTATSTIEQSQSNLAQAFWIYFACFFGMIWLLRKH